jgi:cyclic pyranopterin phosphate synthase
MPDFTHIDAQGNAVMVDVSGKAKTVRQAVASGTIKMNAECYRAVKQGFAQKGDVLATARIAGIMAVKKTGLLIPLCHTLNIDYASVDFSFNDRECAVISKCTVKTSGGTGAEMEALTGVSAALLTIYDMCKALDRAMIIGNVRLCEKAGGKSGHFIRNESALSGEQNSGSAKRC